PSPSPSPSPVLLPPPVPSPSPSPSPSPPSTGSLFTQAGTTKAAESPSARRASDELREKMVKVIFECSFGLAIASELRLTHPSIPLVGNDSLQPFWRFVQVEPSRCVFLQRPARPSIANMPVQASTAV